MPSYIKYLFVGIFCNAFLYFIYLALTNFGIPPTIAMSISYTGGVLIGFILNKNWTFNQRSQSNIYFLKYCVAYAAGYLINLSGLHLLVNALHAPHQGSQAAMVFLVAIFLFVIQRKWVFKSQS